MGSKEHGIDELTEFALRVVRANGKEALSYYGKGDPHLKFDEALVTEAELRLRDLFESQLTAVFPEHRVFPDSREDTGYSHGGNRYLWVYDALDGVANFQAGIPIWGMSIALLENFWPVFGVFHMPATGDIFYAGAGGKAYWGDREITRPARNEIDDESVLLVYSRFRHSRRSRYPGKILALGCTGAHLCYVATGRAEGAVIAHESYQDLAAAAVIGEATGVKFHRMDGAEFSHNEYLTGGTIDEVLLVASPEMSSQIRPYFNGID